MKPRHLNIMLAAAMLGGPFLARGVIPNLPRRREPEPDFEGEDRMLKARAKRAEKAARRAMNNEHSRALNPAWKPIPPIAVKQETEVQG